MVVFGTVLRSLRRAARLSQLQLANSSGVSQRHLSFLESGRSNPGRDVVVRLAQGLALAPEATNDLMEKAGFAAPFIHYEWTSAVMEPLRQAAAHILNGHMPYPAVLVDVAGDVVDANPAFQTALSLLDDPETLWRRTHGRHARNLYRLTLHPDGPARFLLNFEDVARATLRRAASEARKSPRLNALVVDIISWPNIDPAWCAVNLKEHTGPIIEELYRAGKAVASVFAITTTIGAPCDFAAGALHIESYFPADAATKTLLERVGARDQNTGGRSFGTKP
jgi:transcriptional regulator with XRE-family HTH domain